MIEGFNTDNKYWVEFLKNEDLIHTQMNEYELHTNPFVRITTINGIIESIKDNPSIEYYNNVKYWFKNNEFHREWGPAIVTTSGIKKFFFENTEITKEEFIVQYRKMHLTDDENVEWTDKEILEIIDDDNFWEESNDMSPNSPFYIRKWKSKDKFAFFGDYMMGKIYEYEYVHHTDKPDEYKVFLETDEIQDFNKSEKDEGFYLNLENDNKKLIIFSEEEFINFKRNIILRKIFKSKINI